MFGAALRRCCEVAVVPRGVEVAMNQIRLAVAAERDAPKMFGRFAGDELVHVVASDGRERSRCHGESAESFELRIITDLGHDKRTR